MLTTGFRARDHRPSSAPASEWDGADVARIAYRGGVLWLSVMSPYDRETLFEYAESAAKQYGKAGLEIDRHKWVVAADRRGSGGTCTRCNQELKGFRYTNNGSRALCTHCAKKEGALL